jgi:hypothetical protein
MYMEAAELINSVEGSAQNTVATGNAVLAAIAAGDAICCEVAKVRYRGERHRDAADFLAEVTGRKELGDWLRSVVDLKDAGHYGLQNVGTANTNTALRNARKLVDAAGSIVR